MPIQIERNQSGTKDYGKVTGDDRDLTRVSRRTHEPIHPQDGRNPAHVDVPARKLERINDFPTYSGK